MIARKIAGCLMFLLLFPLLASAETRRVKVTWDPPEDKQPVSVYRVYIDPDRQEVEKRKEEKLIYQTEKRCICFYLPDDESAVYIGVTAINSMGMEEVGIGYFDIRDGRPFPGNISPEQCDFCEEGGPTVSFQLKKK